MTETVKKAIAEFNMLGEGESVLVGLSGGADSVALLLMLIELGYEVSACHINHCLRGDESDRDEAFCRRLCEDKNIKLFVERIDVNTFCRENKLGIEEGARHLRYQAFNKYADGGKIATAHTIADSLETTLINLARGTALRGLCGIPPVRDNIIRPLIFCTRADIEEFLKEENQDFVTDSTNLSADYTRNKIRLEIIPKLCEINPSLHNSYAKTLVSLRNDDDFLDRLADETLEKAKSGEGYSAEVLLQEDKAVATRCIAKILKAKGLECNSDKVTEILRIMCNNGKINLSGDVYAIVKSGKLEIKIIKTQEQPCFEEKLNIGQNIFFMDKCISANVKTFNYCEIVNETFTTTIIDYDKIQGKAIVRNRRNGDRIKFQNREHTTSVKKLFNSDIPLDERDKIIFIADEDGVIFVEGYGVSERVAVDRGTKNVLELVITERMK